MGGDARKMMGVVSSRNPELGEGEEGGEEISILFVGGWGCYVHLLFY